MRGILEAFAFIFGMMLIAAICAWSIGYDVPSKEFGLCVTGACALSLIMVVFAGISD